MARQRKEFSPFSLVATLVVICGLAGFVLAGVNRLTAPAIERAMQAGKVQAVQQVLGIDAEQVQDALAAGEAAGGAYYPHYGPQGALQGAAVPVADENGYGGRVELMVGLNADGEVIGVARLLMNETPGLGDKAFKPEFLDQFLGQSENSIAWEVRKDGGDVDSVTAATITSRAVTSAVASVFQVFETIPETKP